MKSILIKNIRIQFDTFDEGADQFTARNTLDSINSVLQDNFPDITPQIFVGKITEDDIEIADQPDLEDEDISEVKAEFVSVWDGGTTIATSCNYNKKTKVVSDIECADVDGLDLEMLDEEYVLLSDGTKITNYISED